MWEFIKLRYKLFLALIVFWFLLALNFRVETIIAGVFIAFLITTLASYGVLYDKDGYLYHGVKIRTIFVYIFFLFYQIYKASIFYVFNLLAHHYEPVVFTMKLDVDDPVLVGIISNSITLTPGTITIDSDSEKFTVTVLTLAKEGSTIEELQKPIRENFEKLLKQKGDIK